MANLDLKKDLKHLYSAKQTPHTVDVPSFHYLMVDGRGDPNTVQQYKDAVTALYNLAYGIRAICKSQGNSFTVMPLQGLWDLPLEAIAPLDKSQFVWTMMILQPAFVTSEIVEAARKAVRAKKNPPVLDDIRFEAYSEGQVAHILHIGPYADEKPTIDKLHAYMAENRLERNGMHHEIYLSNPGRVAPEKLKTIIRQPVK